MKAQARRAEILDHLADHILANGLVASSLRPLAKAAQTSDRMLLYYFKDKAELISAALALIGARLVAHLDARTSATPRPFDQLCPALVAIALADDLWPYMRVWLEIAGLAAKGDPDYRAVGEKLGRGFLAWGAAQLDSPTAAARDVDAARLLITIEGSLLLKSIGLDDVLERARAR